MREGVRTNTAYLSPSYGFTGKNIEMYDLMHRRQCENGSENLRRALLRFYQRRADATEVG